MRAADSAFFRSFKVRQRLPQDALVSSGFLAAQNAVHDVETERAVAFELRFAEKLIRRFFVGKRLVGLGIAPDAGAFGAVIGRLDVENVTVFALRPVSVLAVSVAVVHGAERVIRDGPALLRLRIRGFSRRYPGLVPVLDLGEAVEANADAEIDVDLA